MRYRMQWAMVLPLMVAACDSATDSPQTETERQLEALRNLITPIQTVNAATAAGFDTDLTGCLENQPTGGMGHHYGNVSRIDGAAPTVLEPEILVFAPVNGTLRLGAVEYIIPYDLWQSTQPPRLFEHEFHRNDDFGIWMLHAWLWIDNPAGMFADWNPAVRC